MLLVRLKGEVCNFIKSNTPPWVFSHFNVAKSRYGSTTKFSLNKQTLPFHVRNLADRKSRSVSAAVLANNNLLHVPYPGS